VYTALRPAQLCALPLTSTPAIRSTTDAHHRDPQPRQRLRIVSTLFHSAIFFAPPLVSCTDSLNTYSFALLSCVFSGTREETPLGWDRCQRSHGSGSPAECHVDTSTPPRLHLTCTLAKHWTRSSPHRIGSVCRGLTLFEGEAVPVTVRVFVCVFACVCVSDRVALHRLLC